MSKISTIQLIVFTTLLSSCVVTSNEPTGNAENGEKLFVSASCAACHGVTIADTTMVGPSLFGIIGRKAGTSPSLLGASRDLKEYGVTWGAETLDKFLIDPYAEIPGTPMIGKLIDPQERADVIAYLSTLKE